MIVSCNIYMFDKLDKPQTLNRVGRNRTLDLPLVRKMNYHLHNRRVIVSSKIHFMFVLSAISSYVMYFFFTLIIQVVVIAENSEISPFLCYVEIFLILCSYLAKILVPEGSKDVLVGQPIAITVCPSGHHLLMFPYCPIHMI